MACNAFRPIGVIPDLVGVRPPLVRCIAVKPSTEDTQAPLSCESSGAFSMWCELSTETRLRISEKGGVSTACNTAEQELSSQLSGLHSCQDSTCGWRVLSVPSSAFEHHYKQASTSWQWNITHDIKQSSWRFRTTGNTPLHYAAINGDYKLIEHYLTLDMSPAARNRMGQTPEDCARRCGHTFPALLLQICSAFCD